MREFTLEIQGKGTILGILEEHDKQYYQVMHDFEMPSGIRSAAPCPEVYRLEPHVGILLTEQLQWFWFNMFVEFDAGRNSMETLKIWWRSLTESDTAFTNGRGTNNCRDYVSNRNLDKELPMFYPLVCGGNVLTGKEVIFRQIPCLQVETIDTTKSLVGISRSNTPWLVQLATNVREDGTVIRFPQLRGNDVPIPILGTQPIHYPLSYLKKLPMGSKIPTPYRFII